MADNAPEPVVTAAETVAPSQGPAAATPQAAAPSTVAGPAALSSPVVADAPVTAIETPASEPAAAAATAEPKSEAAVAPASNDGSLLGDTLKPEADPTAEKPVPEVAKVEPVQSDLPSYEKFTLPEGVTLDDSKLGNFNKILGEFETGTKTDHTKMQVLGQQLIDMYTGEAKDLSQRVAQNQIDVWNRTREGWKEDFRKDREIGGNRQQTTIKQCKAVLERYAASAGDTRAKALTKVFSLTGAGDNPAMIHFINWSSQFATERTRPVAATVPKAPVTNSRAQRRYAGSQGE